MKKLFNIYLCGNPLVERDSLPIQLKERLSSDFPQLEFKELDPTAEIPLEEKLIIIDTAEGIEKIHTVTDIKQLKTPSALSLHDFDLAWHLKWMKKLGRLNDLLIFCLPMHQEHESIVSDLYHHLQTNLGAESVSHNSCKDHMPE